MRRWPRSKWSICCARSRPMQLASRTQHMSSAESPRPTFPRHSPVRMLAFQALCVYEAVGDAFDEQIGGFLSDSSVHEDLGLKQPPTPKQLAAARTLAQSAWREHERLDADIAAAAAHWSLARLTPVDRNVIRLGAYELRHAPPKHVGVIISDAVDLARKFGDADSPAFVNGVLDAIHHRRSAAPPTDADSSGN
ncbi:MAG: transcription antitermination factor NusB [Planctomycetota bacterium]|nr:MAG: transcription antitermination factor NusB [Planctomycetota bacterium]